MTLAQDSIGTAIPSGDDGRSTGSGITVVDTTELRWFAEGPIPVDVRAWFTGGDTRGAVEDRCDSYRLDDQPAVGVKRRFRTTLELKTRQSVEDHLSLAPGLSGRREVWRKWSPAGGFAESSAPWPWLDVGKTVIKRRFSVGGSELEHSAEVDTMEVAGCDVEVAAVRVGDVDAWTFAFAAFGPVSTRLQALTAAWRELRADEHFPDGFGSSFTGSCGYPEWLLSFANVVPVS
jgi:hypothetical protein